MSKKSKKKFRHVSNPVGQHTSATTMPVSRGEDFNPDYSDVIKDLKRIGLLAGTFFTVLIVLSFILK
jgi:hypothetical protein